MLRNLGIRHFVVFPLPENAPPKYITVYSTVLSDGRQVSGENYEGLITTLREIGNDVAREIQDVHNEEQRARLKAVSDEIKVLVSDFTAETRSAASKSCELQRRTLDWIAEHMWDQSPFHDQRATVQSVYDSVGGEIATLYCDEDELIAESTMMDLLNLTQEIKAFRPAASKGSNPKMGWP